MNSFVLKLILKFILIGIGLTANAQDPNELLKSLPPDLQRQLMNQATDKGPITFKAIPAKSTISAKIMNVPTGIPQVYNDAFTGGSVFVMEVNYDADICPNDPNGSPDFTFWVLYLNESDFNKFTANQQGKRASLNIQGVMDKYKPASDFCASGAIDKVDSGLGGMSVSFKTHTHLNPRNFQVWEGSMNEAGSLMSARQVRQFLRKHMISYYKSIDNYTGKPHKERIGNNGTNTDVDPGGKVKVPAGNETETEGESWGWKAIRDGMTSVKNVAKAFSVATNVKGLMNSGIRLFGPAKQYNNRMTKDIIGGATAAFNLSGFDPNSIAENVINNQVNDMVSAMAKINKKYADNGNIVAQQVQQRATKPIKDPRDYKKAIDGDLMAYQLIKTFDQLDDLEEDINQMNIPTNVASGMIWGPGLWQSIRSYGQPGAPVSSVANSVAPSENKALMDPKMLDALRKSGIDIPDIDLEALMKEAQDKIPDDVEIDLNEPLFNGQLWGTKMKKFRGGEWPTLFLNFAISSPNEPIAEDGLDENTIWDQNAIIDDSDIPKSELIYISKEGNDGNPGTELAPFATLQKALDVAHLARLRKSPTTIIVNDGIYKQTAEVIWNIPNLPPLTIKAQNKHGAIFTGAEKVVNTIQWQAEGTNWKAPKPLHPDQLPYTPNTNPLTHPVPVLSVNGNRLTHIPLDQLLPAPGIYSLAGSMVRVFPTKDVIDLNNALVEISVRSYALKITGGGNITVEGLRLISYAYPYPNNTPGVAHNGNVRVIGCKFE